LAEAAAAELDLRVVESVAELDLIEPLWNALQVHHSQITPTLDDGTPKREIADAWRIRRAKYERWLKSPGTFFVIAEAGGEPVGYAFVTVGPGYASWATGERLAELETLSVLPKRRGSGVGTALIGAVWRQLAQLGVADMAITTTTTNAGAQSFYERHGFRQRFVVYYGRSPEETS